MTGFTDRGVPPHLGFHTFMTVEEDGTVSSVHQVPDEGFVHECDPDGKCMCGPQMVMSTFNGRVMPMVRHAPLDPAYYEEIFGEDSFDDFNADDYRDIFDPDGGSEEI